jgi:hypothetical protein
MARALHTVADVETGGLSPRLAYGREPLGEPPSRQSRMFETVVGDSHYPDMLKPITGFHTGATARRTAAQATPSQTR